MYAALEVQLLRHAQLVGEPALLWQLAWPVPPLVSQSSLLLMHFPMSLAPGQSFSWLQDSACVASCLKARCLECAL